MCVFFLLKVVDLCLSNSLDNIPGNVIIFLEVVGVHNF